MAAYAALIPIISRFSMLLNYCDVVLPPLILEAIKLADKELKSFRDFVERLDSRSRKRMNASLERIAEAIRNCGILELELRIGAEYEVLTRITHSLVEQFQKAREEYHTLLRELEEGIVSSSSRVVSKSKMVGLHDKWRLLKDDLMDPRICNPFYLLVGMAGMGKTHLAREIFEDLDIMEWFDCSAWVNVGMEWKLEEVTEAILAQVTPEANKKITGGSKEEIGERLKERLKGKRYLVVLDVV